MPHAPLTFTFLCGSFLKQSIDAMGTVRQLVPRRWVTAISLKHSFAIFRRPSLDGYQRQIPSVPPSGGPPDRGSPAALSERSEFSGRPGWRFGGREARRAGAAERDSLLTFLPRSKNVSRPPGRDPAMPSRIAGRNQLRACGWRHCQKRGRSAYTFAHCE